MSYDIQVLINGKNVTKYYHEGKTYIEGRRNSKYKIKLINNSSTRKEFVVSIDGLSIVDGKAASSKSTGYIVNGYSSYDIEGWLVDNKTAAKFTFGSKGSSYASTKGEEAAKNTGVIGLQVFEEKQPEYDYNKWNWDYWKEHSNFEPWISPIKKSPMRYIQCSAGGYVSPTTSALSDTVVGASLQNSNQAFYNLSATPESVGSMGTEFGKATEFNTTTVSFTRASETPVYKSVIYYDESKVLNKLGITMDWQQKPVSVAPNPFPGDYCEPPKGWNK